MNQTRQRHRVAIVVMCEADGVDALDAAHVAEMAIQRALTGDLLTPLPHKLPDLLVQGALLEGPVAVAVMDAGVAAGNGYLWLQPTSKAYREAGLFL